MAAYRPGQGLSTEALQRLRARKQHAMEGLNLPAQDDSKQWDHLLGEGAKKKPRCGICTMPLSSAEYAAKHLVCWRCSSSSARQSEGKKRHPTYESCATPSTQAGSEDWSESDQSTPQETCGSSPAPTSNQLVLAMLIKSLEGTWAGCEGESYRFQCTKNFPWCCVLEEDPRFPLTCRVLFDVEENMLYLGAGKSHILDIAEFLNDSSRLRWSPARTLSETSFVWHRLPGVDSTDTSSTTSEVSLSSDEVHAQRSESAQTMGVDRRKTRRHRHGTWQPSLRRILSDSSTKEPSQ